MRGIRQGWLPVWKAKKPELARPHRLLLDKTHLHFYTYGAARNFVEVAGLEVIGEKPGSGSKLLGCIVARVPPLKQLLAWNSIIMAKRW